MKNHYLKTQLSLLSLLLFCSTAFAQFSVTGTVKDGGGESLIGVSILVKGANVGTVTNLDGTYSINVAGESGVLIFTYTGYAEQEQKVTSANNKLDIALSESATLLDQVVVTGLASSVKRSNLANAISTVSAKELTGVTSVQTLDGALQGKLTGANIVSNSGAPGGGVSVKLRGISTVTGSSEPLYIVDGIYMDNSAFSGGLNPISQARSNGETTDEQDNPSNRIADLNPDDIESIEVLKGASAAAIYGARANAGVIVITTKKGKSGETKVDFNQSFGQSRLIRSLGLRDYTDARVEASFGADELALYQTARDAGKLINYEEEIYGNKGFLYNAHLGISGGNDKTSYFVSGGWKDEEGIIKKTGYNRKSFRLNLNHKFTDWLDFGISTNYINSSADRTITNNDNAGVSLGIALTSTVPWADLLPDATGNYPNNPYAASNPLQTRDLSIVNETTNRFMGGLTINAKLIRTDNSFLKLRLQGGMDYFNNETTGYFPEVLQFMVGNLNGFYSKGNNVVHNINTSAFLVWDNHIGNNIQLTSSAGISRLDFSQSRLTTQATDLIGAQTNLNQASALGVFHRTLDSEDVGYSVQQEANWDDKIIGSFGVRFDQSSLNGDPNELFAYPKASVAVNIANFDFFEMPTFDMVKVRAAYGEAGGVPFPNSNDLGLASQTTLSGANIEGSAGSVVSGTRGNSAIAPERSKELELGIDLGLWNNKLVFEGTYYKKTVEDLILNVGVPSSSGFTVQTLNAGELSNKGIELAVSAYPINSEKLKWYTKVGWWKNTSKMEQLDIPAFTTGSFASSLGIFKIEEGQSLTQIVGPVPTSDGADIVLGDAEPDFQMSWNNNIQFLNNFEFNFLFHWKKGGDNIQLSSLLTDFGQTSYDYDDDDDGDGVVNGDQRINALVSGIPDASQFVEDGSYIKLREVGLFYTFNTSDLSGVLGDAIKRIKVGFSGNNLFIISDYKSYDPEVSNFGNNGVSSGVEVTPFPSSKRLFFHLNIGF
jgi:TonB-linked SusC/RagA family outer membrane protein